MTDHAIQVNFNVDCNMLAGKEGLLQTHRFRNFDVTPEGHLVIKNFHPVFRDKLISVLMDEQVEFQNSVTRLLIPVRS